MSKDKYSNDHTIKIVGDTQTLTIEDNISVEGDGYIAGDLTIAGSILGDLVLSSDLTVDNLTVVNDASVGGNLAVEQEISADSFSWESGTQQMYIDIPIMEVGAALNATSLGLKIAGTVTEDNASVVFGGGLYAAGIHCSGAAPRWDFVIPFDSYLRATVLGGSSPLLNSILISVSSTGGTTGVVSCDIEQVSATGVSTVWGSIASDSQTFSGVALTRELLTFSMGNQAINSYSPDALTRIRFTSVSGNNILFIYKITLIYNVQNVEEAINIISPTT